MIIADGVPIQACIKTDIAFQLPDFFLQGVDLLVDGFSSFLVIVAYFAMTNFKKPQFLQVFYRKCVSLHPKSGGKCV